MRRAGVLAPIAAVALAGCVGSTPLSTSQLHTEATRICAAADKRTLRIGAPSSPAGAAEFLKRGVLVLKPELSALRTLQPPGDLAQVYSISLNSFSRKLHLLEAAVRELDQGADPVAGIETLQQRLAPVESQENGAWRSLEIPGCVNR